MRMLLALAVVGLAACQSGHTQNHAVNSALKNTNFPGVGTPKGRLEQWFDANQYRYGAEVFQSAGELRLTEPDVTMSTRPGDRSWWQSRILTIHDTCVTQRLIYYKLDANERLREAIRTRRSDCG